MRLAWLLIALVWATPVGAAIPNTVGWHDMTNTTVNSVCQWTSGGNAGGSGCSAITDAWNGALFDTLRNRFVLFGNGGHADYFGNEIIAVSVGGTSAITDTQSISRIRNSSASPQSYSGACSLSDGSPRSMHTYTNVAYLPEQDRYLGLGGARSPDGFFQSCVFYWNPTANTYTFLSNSPIDRLSGFTGAAAAWDGERHLLWAIDNFSIFHFNPATNTWTRPSQPGYDGVEMGDMNGAITPVLDRYYLFGGGHVYYFDIKTTSTYARVVPSTSGCGTAMAGQPGVQYDPTQDRIVIWGGGNTIWLFNAATGACTSVSHTGGLAEVSTGTYSKFQYSAKDNLFVACQSSSLNCKALRLSVQSADTDWNRRKNAPGVTHSQGFDTAANYVDGQNWQRLGAPTNSVACDTSTKTSGTCALRMTKNAGHSGDTPSGEWRECLITGCNFHTAQPTTGGAGFGPGEAAGNTFYWSYRFRIDTNAWSLLRSNWSNSGMTGWKHSNMHNIHGGSCGSLEMTGSITPTWNELIQIWYFSCSPGFSTNGSGNLFGVYMQQGNLTQPTTTNGFWCNDSNRVSGAGTGNGCFIWNATNDNEWITFKGKMVIPCWGCNQVTLEIWIAREGATTWQQIINVRNHTWSPPSADQNNRKFNVMDFTNYMTNSSGSAPQAANWWWDEFIVSTEDIDLPGQVSSGGPDTTPPGAPTGITIN